MIIITKKLLFKYVYHSFNCPPKKKKKSKRGAITTSPPPINPPLGRTTLVGVGLGSSTFNLLRVRDFGVSARTARSPFGNAVSLHTVSSPIRRPSSGHRRGSRDDGVSVVVARGQWFPVGFSTEARRTSGKRSLVRNTHSVTPTRV